MGFRDWLKTKKYAPPELTERQKDELKEHERKKVFEMKKRKITERYAPGKPKGKGLGFAGSIFDNLADSARMEFGPKSKPMKGGTSEMEKSPLFGGGSMFGALESEGIVSKAKKVHKAKPKYKLIKVPKGKKVIIR